ncbi:hypothetical protein ACJ4V0_15565 [Phreatobacter sp. HK31-P]
MTKKPSAVAPATATPDVFFEVTVNKVTQAANTYFRPGKTYTVKAHVKDALGKAVETSALVPDVS